MDYDIPVYFTHRYKYVRISDLRPEDQPQLERWIFGYPQPLIQGEKGALQDCVFFEDYQRYLEGKSSPLTDEEKYAIIDIQ